MTGKINIICYIANSLYPLFIVHYEKLMTAFKPLVIIESKQHHYILFVNIEDLDVSIIYDEKLRIGLLSAKFGPKFIILYTLLDNPLNYKRMTWDLTVHKSYLSPRIFYCHP